MSTIGKIYARKGEFITCTNGHKVAEMLCDVHWYELPDLPNQVRHESDQKEPVLGTPLDYCLCHCGAPYVKGGPFNSHIFHFKEGWRE